MCFYRGTLYECKHSEFGKKLSECKDQRDFIAGTSKEKDACTERQIHSMNRVRIGAKCRKCQRLDALRSRTRKTFLSLQENLEKRRTAVIKSNKEPYETGKNSSGVVLSSDDAPEDIAPCGKENASIQFDDETPKSNETLNAFSSFGVSGNTTSSKKQYAA
ncbi:uncharacterized protein ColSpa_08557 [Colletotrichum spaethianum]|uniref:Uncharacterized protein n=1 Tax=Colletotrichum spaethianum TaxID=700344 RepID=A0AA37UJM9_9PEZI|nr:uncharacterized protein ColSpa_08557 [Colletotrichum spaethianum]GKT48376.1 hypothetical protein ColSpa_08557 [Colletotrichum spaethianum]